MRDGENLIEMAMVDGQLLIRGQCDMANADDIGDRLGEHDDEPLQVDLSGVTFFDSCALRAFLTARRRNPKLRIVNPSEAVMRVLEVTSTTEYLADGRGNA